MLNVIEKNRFAIPQIHLLKVLFFCFVKLRITLLKLLVDISVYIQLFVPQFVSSVMYPRTWVLSFCYKGYETYERGSVNYNHKNDSHNFWPRFKIIVRKNWKKLIRSFGCANNFRLQRPMKRKCYIAIYHTSDIVCLYRNINVWPVTGFIFSL